MDSAYDHIQEEVFAHDDANKSSTSDTDKNPGPLLNSELQDAFESVVSSQFGARIGGLWGTVKKASGQYLEEAQKINTAATSSASKGWFDLVNRTLIPSADPHDATQDARQNDPEDSSRALSNLDNDETPSGESGSLTADLVKEAQSMVSRFRTEAAKRLKDIEKAEDAADEALSRLGNNIKSFLQEAVTIAPPEEVYNDQDSEDILFDIKGIDGKRSNTINRLDAQVQALHFNDDTFLQDPTDDEYDDWSKDFDVDQKTESVAVDLEKYPDLRNAMEKLVPEVVDYATFWCRYYFLKKMVELEEQRRKEVLQSAATATAGEEERICWDSDDGDASTPDAGRSTTTLAKATPKGLAPALLRPSDVLSQPDSDASYDLISGAASRAGGSPKEVRKVAEESDEDDWE